MSAEKRILASKQANKQASNNSACLFLLKINSLRPERRIMPILLWA